MLQMMTSNLGIYISTEKYRIIEKDKNEENAKLDE